MSGKELQLTAQEEAVIVFIRNRGPYVDFTIEKRPAEGKEMGEITRIITAESVIVDRFLNEFVKKS